MVMTVLDEAELMIAYHGLLAPGNMSGLVYCGLMRQQSKSIQTHFQTECEQARARFERTFGPVTLVGLNGESIGIRI